MTIRDQEVATFYPETSAIPFEAWAFQPTNCPGIYPTGRSDLKENSPWASLRSRSRHGTTGGSFRLLNRVLIQIGERRPQL